MSCNGCEHKDVYVIEPKRTEEVRSWWLRGAELQIHFCPFCGLSLDLAPPEPLAHAWIVTDSRDQSFKVFAQTAFSAWKKSGVQDSFSRCSFTKGTE